MRLRRAIDLPPSLKMAHERTLPWRQPLHPSPAASTGLRPRPRDGDAPETHYRRPWSTSAPSPWLLGVIFRKATNKVQDPPSSAASSPTIDKRALSP